MVVKKKEMQERFTLEEESDWRKAEREVDAIIRLKYVTGNKIIFFFKIETNDHLKEELGALYQVAGWTVELTPFKMTLS